RGRQGHLRRRERGEGPQGGQRPEGLATVETYGRPLVFNAGMRVTRLVLATLAALLVLPAVAGAKIIEVGDVGSKLTPSCPDSPCEVISRTTAYQTRLGDDRDFFVVPKDGRIVAWTIALGKPPKKQI